MVTRTITATVAEDGTIRLPDGVARPGDTVRVQIERSATEESDHPTVSPAPDPLIVRWREIGRHNRAQLTEDQLARLNGDWLYDENGLPK